MLTQEQWLNKQHCFHVFSKSVSKEYNLNNLSKNNRNQNSPARWAKAVATCSAAWKKECRNFSRLLKGGCHSHRCSCSLPVSPALPLCLFFLLLAVTRHLSRHFSLMEICSSSLQTGRLCERMQSLGDGLSGSVYWHALIWHWAKGMSHRLQTHYHITATPANREAAPRIRVELHQRSLI